MTTRPCSRQLVNCSVWRPSSRHIYSDVTVDARNTVKSAGLPGSTRCRRNDPSPVQLRGSARTASTSTAKSFASTPRPSSAATWYRRSCPATPATPLPPSAYAKLPAPAGTTSTGETDGDGGSGGGDWLGAGTGRPPIFAEEPGFDTPAATSSAAATTNAVVSRRPEPRRVGARCPALGPAPRAREFRTSGLEGTEGADGPERPE